MKEIYNSLAIMKGNDSKKISRYLRIVNWEIKVLAIIFLFIIQFSSCIPQKSFNLVLLPDTQKYSESYPEIFKAQTEWIVENADSIAFVLHQGDITENNTDNEWKNAVEALNLLNGIVPFAFVPGNHDIGDPGKNANTRDSKLFNKYMPYEKYNKMENFGGAFKPGKMENTWHTFNAGGSDWLILCLEFGPRNKVLDWAAEVIETHPNHKVIINTHTYLYSDGMRISPLHNHKWVPQRYGVGQYPDEDAPNDGEMMWEKLVSRHPNILFVFSGHVLNNGTARLVSEGLHGNKVYQMLANYQGGVIGSENGGNGYLRIITINTKQNKISVKSYSPYINQYKTDPDHQFEYKNIDF